jgi:D-tyrosyl-tRNA(Tyr) deacylase
VPGVRGLVQRVTEGWVDVTGDDGVRSRTGRIGAGVVVLVGVTHDDTEADADRLAERVAHLRIHPDDDGVMNRSLLDVGGAALVVSQFTLYADTSRGRRPSYVDAARPEHAEPLVERVAERLAALGVEVATGRFRTHMHVGLVNDGPVTILVES